MKTHESSELMRAQAEDEHAACSKNTSAVIKLQNMNGPSVELHVHTAVSSVPRCEQVHCLSEPSGGRVLWPLFESCLKDVLMLSRHIL